MNLFRTAPKAEEQVSGPGNSGHRATDATYWARRAQELLRVPVADDCPTVSGALPGRVSRAISRVETRVHDDIVNSSHHVFDQVSCSRKPVPLGAG